MLHAATRLSHFLPPFSISSPSKPLLPRSLKPYRTPATFVSPIRMSTSTRPQIVEHFVLFKVKPDTDPSKISTMVNGLNGLNSLDEVLHITAGEVIRSRSSTLTFTHMLHSRYNSKVDLATYAAHPGHVSVVTESVRPIVDDVMALDFLADDLAGPVTPRPGSAMRVSFFKLKDGMGEKEKSEVLGVIGGLKNQVQSVDQVSFGENFSPERAKGFSIGSLAIFPGLTELDALDSNQEFMNMNAEKLKDFLDSVVVLDYMIPKTQSANL